MALRYFVNGGVSNNWGQSPNTNWSLTSGGAGGQAIPTSADDVFFDANSPNCTVNSAQVCKSIDFTGYTNTITMTFGITVSGNITFKAGLLVAGSGSLAINATGTITTNGFSWANAFGFGGNSAIYTFADPCTISGLTTFAYATTMTLNGSSTNKLIMAGGLTVTTTATMTTGTADLNITGGTWQHTAIGAIVNNLFINGNVIIGANIYYRTGTLTYTSGTVDTTTNNSTLNIGASCTLNTSGINWNYVTIAGTTPTITLTSNLNASNLVTIGSGANITTITSSGGTRTITCGNGFTNGSTTGTIVCNANIKVTGGIITGSTTIGTLTGYLQINNSPYQFEIAGNVTFATATAFYIYGGASNTGKFLYTSGIVTTTGSSIYFNALLINSGSINFNNVWFATGGLTYTLQSDIIVNGLLTLGYLNTTFSINNDGSTRTIIASNGISMSGTTGVVTGSANIRCTGGTITGISTVTLRNNLEIAGNVTFANGVTFYYSTGILKYTSGDVTTTNSTLSIFDSSAILNTNGIIWNNIICVNYSLSLISNLTCQNFSLGSIAINNNGGNVFILGNLTVTASNATKGTAIINLIGTGVWSGAQFLGHDLTFNMGLNGVITILGNVYFGYATGIYTNIYKSGVIKISGIGGLSGNQFVIYGTQTFIDFHKVPLTNILIVPSASPTFNQFFTGTPTKPCLIYTNVNTQNYIINFTDGFERIAKYVNITGCTLGKPQQLIVITAKKIVNNTAYTTLGAPNVGIRYINQSPNGIPKNKPTLTQTTYGTQMLLNDPGMK